MNIHEFASVRWFHKIDIKMGNKWLQKHMSHAEMQRLVANARK